MESRSTSSFATVGEHNCPVVANDAAGRRYRHMVLDAPPSALAVEPGQFFMLLCPRDGDHAPYLRRPMSAYHVDRDNNRLEFLYRVVGDGTRALAALKPGSSLNIAGPLGVGFSLDPTWRRILVAARGCGVATLAPLVMAASRRGTAAIVVLSAEIADDLLSGDRLRAVGADVIEVTDSDGTSGVDNVDSILRRAIADAGADALFTCGSERLLSLMRRLGHEHGIPGQAALEERMACGLGMCHSCIGNFRVGDEIVERQVCADGPVFDLQETLPW
jgi:dihydroorotate dehydrogenase electron transfer subunit